MRRTTFTLYRDAFGNDVPCAVLSIGSGSPRVVMTALQHGNEALGLEAGLQAMHHLEKRGLHGTLTLLTCLNPVGFFEGTRDFLDRSFNLAGTTQMNLNRVHPGNAHGALIERTAHAINGYIETLKPDYLIDLHAYSAQSVPHLILDLVDDAMFARLLGWAEASGVPYYREFAAEEYAAQALTNCLPAIWCERAVPSVTLELGPQHGFGPDECAAATATVLNTLHAAGATSKRAPLAPETQTMVTTLSGKQWQRAGIANTSSAMGYARHLVGVGTYVVRGEVISEVVQLDGRVGGQVTAPHEGVVFIWHDDPRVYPGSKLGVMLYPYEPMPGKAGV